MIKRAALQLSLNHIVKLPNGKYRLLSHEGKNLGTFDSHEAAAKHERQVEYFKHNAKGAWIAANRRSGTYVVVPVLNYGTVRHAMLHGRKHLVVPMTLIKPQVLNGSKGPLLYPKNELEKDPTAWNGMPLVLNHPEEDGHPVSARQAHILNKYGMGVVLGARTEKDGTLKAEGWFDVQNTRRVHQGVYTSLMQGKPIEISTGLFTDNEPKRGVHNGSEYHYIARNYRPDHLAILPDKVGACSVKDGCGALVDNKDSKDGHWVTYGGKHHFINGRGEEATPPKPASGRELGKHANRRSKENALYTRQYQGDKWKARATKHGPATELHYLGGDKSITQQRSIRDDHLKAAKALHAEGKHKEAEGHKRMAARHEWSARRVEGNHIGLVERLKRSVGLGNNAAGTWVPVSNDEDGHWVTFGGKHHFIKGDGNDEESSAHAAGTIGEHTNKSSDSHLERIQGRVKEALKGSKSSTESSQRLAEVAHSEGMSHKDTLKHFGAVSHKPASFHELGARYTDKAVDYLGKAGSYTVKAAGHGASHVAGAALGALGAGLGSTLGAAGGYLAGGAAGGIAGYASKTGVAHGVASGAMAGALGGAGYGGAKGAKIGWKAGHAFNQQGNWVPVKQ